MEHLEHTDELSDAFFAPPDLATGSLQTLKELGPKYDRFRKAFRTTLAAGNGLAGCADAELARSIANDIQAYAFYMTPEQAGRFAAEELLRAAKLRKTS